MSCHYTPYRNVDVSRPANSPDFNFSCYFVSSVIKQKSNKSLYNNVDSRSPIFFLGKRSHIYKINIWNVPAGSLGLELKL